LVKVIEPPRLTAPPPFIPVPAVIVTDELARLEFEIPADPDRLELVSPLMVLELADIVLLVSVSVVSLPSKVSEALGRVRVRLAVAVPPCRVVVLVLVALSKITEPVLVLGVPRVRGLDPVKASLAKVGVEEVAILWGSERVTLPVDPDTETWLAVPASDVTPALVIVIDPPRLTAPPPETPVPALMVTAELARLALEMPADPDRLEFVSPEIVLDPATIVLFVSVSKVACPTKVSVALGKVRVRLELGLQVIMPVCIDPRLIWFESFVSVIAANDGVAAVPIPCGRERVTAPVELEMLT
jgi:hypothetical protein